MSMASAIFRVASLFGIPQSLSGYWFGRKCREIYEEFERECDGPLNALYEAYNASGQSLDAWALQVYFDKRIGVPFALELNNLRKRVLVGLYKVVNEWETYGYSTELEDVMLSNFRATKIIRILGICVPMDRAHALLAMSNSYANNEYGLHWYSKLHLEDDSEFMRSDPQAAQIRDQLLAYQKERRAKATMDKYLYRLLYSRNAKLNLQENEQFRSWSQPAFADFVQHDVVHPNERAQTQMPRNISGNNLIADLDDNATYDSSTISWPFVAEERSTPQVPEFPAQ